MQNQNDSGNAGPVTGTLPPWLLELGAGEAGHPGAGGGSPFAEEDLIWPLWLTVSASVTITVGFVSNAWILYCGFGRKDLRSSPFHLLLMNHSIVSTLLSVFVYPVLIYRSNAGLSKSWTGTQLCRVGYMCLFWWISVALFNSAAMAINRALSCFPFVQASQFLRSLKGTYAILSMVWLLSLPMYLVPAVHLSTGWAVGFLCFELDDLLKNFFTSELDLFRAIIRYECSLTVLFVLLVSLACYGVIVNHLFSCFKISSTAAKDSARRRQERKRALGVIALGFGIFLLCWVPDMWIIMWKSELLSELPFLNCLPMLDTALNPILYMVCLPVFRPARLRRAVGPQLSTHTAAVQTVCLQVPVANSATLSDGKTRPSKVNHTIVKPAA